MSMCMKSVMSGPLYYANPKDSEECKEVTSYPVIFLYIIVISVPDPYFKGESMYTYGNVLLRQMEGAGEVTTVQI